MISPITARYFALLIAAGCSQTEAARAMRPDDKYPSQTGRYWLKHKLVKAARKDVAALSYDRLLKEADLILQIQNKKSPKIAIVPPETAVLL